MPAIARGKINPDAPPRLLIVGASARAAAWSARRAGWRPICADQFADADLRQVAEVIPIRDYPASLVSDLAEIVVDGWMFVGAMENHVGILRRMVAEPRFGRYFGPPLKTIRALRDPRRLAERLASCGCYPDALLSASEIPSGFDEAGWLRKPYHGAGGRGIRFVTDTAGEQHLAERCYWQRFVPGEPCSALFLITPAEQRLLLVTRQWIGWDACRPPSAWSYCGSIGPWPVSKAVRDRLHRIAAAVCDGLEYRGLLGIDFVCDGERAWVVEINPRYPASAELWDFATGRSIVAEHLRCFFHPAPEAEPLAATFSERLLAKAVLYADRPISAPDLSRWLIPLSKSAIPFAADLPVTGARIPAGGPICTLFATGESLAACQQKLARRLARVRGWFAAD